MSSRAAWSGRQAVLRSTCSLGRSRRAKPRVIEEITLPASVHRPTPRGCTTIRGRPVPTVRTSPFGLALGFRFPYSVVSRSPHSLPTRCLSYCNAMLMCRENIEDVDICRAVRRPHRSHQRRKQPLAPAWKWRLCRRTRTPRSCTHLSRCRSIALLRRKACGAVGRPASADGAPAVLHGQAA